MIELRVFEMTAFHSNTHKQPFHETSLIEFTRSPKGHSHTTVNRQCSLASVGQELSSRPLAHLAPYVIERIRGKNSRDP